MSLDLYKSRRDFSKTSEPEALGGESGSSRFVVQKHQARSLHYDFRLEMDGVLKSWAVPKGVPEKAGIKRLAILVEDHPIGYIEFSGAIPPGEYGAGTVEIWDQGKWNSLEGSLTSGIFKFNLDGDKLKGTFVLVKLKDENNWLIYKV